MIDTLPRLSRDLVDSLAFGAPSGLEVPPSRVLSLPVKVVQFGTGAFLRGFAEYFIDEANRAGRFNGSIVAVSSTGSTRDEVLNAQDGLFTLVLQGVEANAARQRYRVVASLNRAISARHEWDAVLELAADPAITIVISNTTEVGIALDPDDQFDAEPPRSFPGKLTRFLAARARVFEYDRTRGLVVLPCELVEQNGDKLRDIVRTLAAKWKLDDRFLEWLEESVHFCNTLVDRIVPGVPSGAEAVRIESLFGYRDGMLTAAEPYALFAIQGDAALRDRLAFPGDDPRIVVEPDIRPYRERKVRILNGAHTIMAPLGLLAGVHTVGDAAADPIVGECIRRAMFDEIVPFVEASGAEAFAREVLDRFANPYIRHALIDITLYQTTKMRVRVVPSILAYHEATGRVPSLLAFGFAAYLAFLRGEIHAERRTAGESVPPDPDGDSVRAAWRSTDVRKDGAIAALARDVCAKTELWGTDLRGLTGFSETAGRHLVHIVRDGMRSALRPAITDSATAA